MKMWEAALLKRGALSVVKETNVELSERVLALALQQAQGVMLLEDDQASLLRTLTAHDAVLGRTLVETLAQRNLPILAAGNAVRLLGERAHFGSPGAPEELDLPGLGCLKSTVLDKRVWSPDGLEILLREALPVPGGIAFGLSSDTALVVSGTQATVAGTGTVVVLDLQRATGMKPGLRQTVQPSGVHGVGLSLMPPQSSYDLVSREPRS
jgi:cyanophycinase-like exopeptidase